MIWGHPPEIQQRALTEGLRKKRERKKKRRPLLDDGIHAKMCLFVFTRRVAQFDSCLSGFWLAGTGKVTIFGVSRQGNEWNHGEFIGKELTLKSNCFHFTLREKKSDGSVRGRTVMKIWQFYNTVLLCNVQAFSFCFLELFKLSVLFQARAQTGLVWVHAWVPVI